MKKKNLKSILAIAMALILSLACFAGCGQSAVSTESGVNLANGGVLCLKVNPEIAINYDESGLVTGVTARNDDALKILANYSGFQGKATRTVVSELVTAIGNAGYFVEEIEGQRRQITLEIEPGSSLPNDTFLDDVIADVKSAVDNHNWQTPLSIEGTTDFGITDYVDTDYGPGNDGNTNYDDTDYGPNNDGITDYDHNINNDSDYGEGNDGVTDYDGTDYWGNTDYGVNADGNTDYNDSDYGVWGDGITDYDHSINDDSDYGPNNDGITDYDGTDYYDNTDYGVNADGNTDYNDSDYGIYGDGVTDYNPPASSGSNKPSSSGGDSGYSDSAYGDSGYSSSSSSSGNYGSSDSGYSNYGSGYGES